MAAVRLLASLMLLPFALGAQTSVVGVVLDGLSNKPLAAATVQLVLASNPAGRMQTAQTDADGVYHLDRIAPGSYLLTFTHERLEELGIELPPRKIDVSGAVPTVRYELAVPGPRALARVLCGERADSSGVLAGRVMDAEGGVAVSAGSVMASWVELRVIGSAVQRIPRGLKTGIDDAGRFAICGVPSDIPVRVSATAGAARSGEFEIQVQPSALLHREVFVSASTRMRGTARVSGHVRSTAGRPIERAQVILLDSGISDVTDATGAFTLDSLPAGTRGVEVRALGFVPAQMLVDLKSGLVVSRDLALAPRTALLDAVTVFGKAPKRGEAGAFSERAKGMFGRFYTGDQVAKSGVTSLPELFRMVPGLRVVQASGSFLNTILSRGEGFDASCMPDVYLDGMLIADGALSLDNLVRPSEIGGIEVYVDAMTVPVQFRRGACGSIVIWTKIMVP
ncbi:MAG: TonB-dependent receptor plug [Gemmatimonadetes bacterium]|nr:TonB-dependent receptor plug [Gemmatimonadota bacterium]